MKLSNFGQTPCEIVLILDRRDCQTGSVGCQIRRVTNLWSQLTLPLKLRSRPSPLTEPSPSAYFFCLSSGHLSTPARSTRRTATKLHAPISSSTTLWPALSRSPCTCSFSRVEAYLPALVLNPSQCLMLS